MRELLFLSTICLAITGCNNRSARTSSNANWEAEYRKRIEAQMDEYERQTRRVTTFQDLQSEQNERYEKLLDRWEKQVNRQDAILDAQEKQLDIKK
jgi:hypothetical protein